MSPIRLDGAERAALKKLIKLNGICEYRQISSLHARKFLQLGLLIEIANGYHITLRGQLEVLRQRFRKMPASKKSVTISRRTRTLLSTNMFG